jgi:signal transduction histidine kinase
MAPWLLRAPAAAGLALGLSSFVPLEAGPLPGRPASVLFVDPGDGGRPLFPELMSGFRERLRDARDVAPVTVHTVNMDVATLSSVAAREALDTLVGERYGAEPLGAVVAFREPTFDRATAWRDRLWPGTPIFAVADSPGAEAHARRLGARVLRLEMGARDTVLAARALFPGRRRVAFVAGVEFLNQASESFASVRGLGVEVDPLVGLPMNALLERVASLPESSFILFGGLNRDGAGRYFTSRDALDLVASRASVPVLVDVSTLVGRGVIGGEVVDFAQVGRATADAVVGYLRGHTPPAPTAIDATRLLFDGRELDRWKVPPSVVPARATVLFRPPTLWQEHRGKVIAGLTIGALQTAVIGALLMQHRRRREAEDGLRRLSARLMTAQEDERRRIARDLHDDVCQRLVLMAVDLDLLKGDRTDGGGRPATGEGRTSDAIAEAARGLSADVQRIAYELHPASLDRLGLVHAVERFARDATARSGIRIDTDVEGWPDRELPQDVTLALYRVVQEGLQNVVRHSGAARAKVALRAGGDGLRVRVADDGRGFDPELAAENGLGLIGMRERLQLHGGRITVASGPGQGTVVEAWVPASVLAMPATPAVAGVRP